ncbi:hypothetical protein DPMN_068830 [Dreissena polymorpha]|uniref:Uncharacterized protein n=1 Tax=Dreissena polymorpha TaxID=45954 RepID=A0A9D4BWW0_DREPO|nr:hypothetical protein DPMN_068819 [Dreissena polymorpha]KAH3709368.1 hypothetical protein DPMN_068830 [Dreissena polymorpha]
MTKCKNTTTLHSQLFPLVPGDLQHDNVLHVVTQTTIMMHITDWLVTTGSTT